MRGTSNQEYGRFYTSDNKSSQSKTSIKPPNPKSYGFNYGHSEPTHVYTQEYYANTGHGSTYNNSLPDYTKSRSLPQFNVSYPKTKETPNARDPSVSIYAPTSSGLPNLGNTCYMNSTLQCLFNTKSLHSYFANGNNLIDAPNCPLNENFGRLLAVAFSKSSPESIQEALEIFRESVGDLNSSFMGYAQHDAHEIFRFILEKMHKELNQARVSDKIYTEFKLPPGVTSLAKHAEEWKKFSNARDDSKINSLFGGCLLSEVVCESCNNKSYSFENTLDLPLDIPRNNSATPVTKTTAVSLAKCFQDFTSEVTVLEYLCSKCNKKRKSRRKVTIWRQPEILVIQLKRFVYDKYGNLEALKGDVSFPLTDLDLTPFTHKESKELRAKYKLFGFVNHYGSLDRGHYTAIINNEEDNSWILYDDDRVSNFTRREIEQIAQGSANPYLLCYKRVK